MDYATSPGVGAFAGAFPFLFFFCLGLPINYAHMSVAPGSSDDNRVGTFVLADIPNLPDDTYMQLCSTFSVRIYGNAGLPSDGVGKLDMPCIGLYR